MGNRVVWTLWMYNVHILLNNYENEILLKFDLFYRLFSLFLNYENYALFNEKVVFLLLKNLQKKTQ